MSFENKINQLVENIIPMKEKISNEEATKTSFILPFIRALGYDIFDPTEVVPEFTADVGSKKGEKVDYAICIDNSPVFLYECKWCQKELSDVNASQLRRYFHETTAKIAILTNGLQYQFFSDLDDPNIMDASPFMVLDLENIDYAILKEVKKLSKTDFEIDDILSTATELKYIRMIRLLLQSEFDNPSSNFVKFFTKQVYPKKISAPALEQFTRITKKALRLFLKTEISQRLDSALSQEDAEINEKEQQEELESTNAGIVTTEEELEGFYIVRAILSKDVEPYRICHRDTKSYFGILLDDNNRKPLCRLHFNTKQKYIELFDSQRKGSRHPIEQVIDVHNYSDHLLKTLELYK